MNQPETIIEPVEQIWNIGGPWVGNLIISGKKYEGKFLSGDVIFDVRKSVLYAARYFDKGYFQWQCYFKIEAISIYENRVYLSKKKFKSLCLVTAYNGVLDFYECFCGGAKATINRIEYNDVNFEGLVS